MSALLRCVRDMHHVFRVVIRNMKHPYLQGPSDVYYTLTLVGQRKPFYISEVAKNTLNPTWDYIQASDFLVELPYRVGAVNINVFLAFSGGDASASSSSSASSSGQDNGSNKESDMGANVNQSYRRRWSRSANASSGDELLLQLRVDFHDLEWIHPLKESTLPSFPPNAVLLYLSDGIYVQSKIKDTMDRTDATVRKAVRALKAKVKSHEQKAAIVEGAQAAEQLTQEGSASVNVASEESARARRIQEGTTSVWKRAVSHKSNTDSRRPRVAPRKSELNDLLNHAARMMAYQAQLLEVKADIAKAQETLNARVARRNTNTQRARDIRLRQQRAANLRRLVQHERALLADDRQRVLELRRRLAPHAQLVAQQSRSLYTDKYKQLIAQAERSLQINKRTLAGVRRNLLARQRKLISHLSAIYPIRRVTSPGIGPASSGGSKSLSIRDVVLSPATMAASTGDEHVSTALGYAAHFVFMFAKYFEIPLRYRIVFRGSRSGICDDVNSNVVYPLYNGDQQRFLIACNFLLKDIVQIARVRHPQRKINFGKSVLSHLDALVSLEIPH
eukprot:TRINITY_DN30488_c0_g1_i1.p1 TRINITY_DN30488_c0_g1~~TRINITY_DN30488_c0_g1_i1.p1  ORF type:complete len:587 (+),score=279.68 TRINITY_DN30488_c0_g1_i1:80-1762(+)